MFQSVMAWMNYITFQLVHFDAVPEIPRGSFRYLCRTSVSTLTAYPKFVLTYSAVITTDCSYW